MTDSSPYSRMMNSLLYRSHPFVMVNCLASVIFLCIRLYELSLTAGYEHEGSSFTALAVQAVWIDLLFISGMMFILSLIYFALSTVVKDRIALAIHTLLLAMLALLSLGLSHYFTITHIPLGADLYGYSFDDIIETVTSSGGLNLVIPAVMVLIVGIIILLPKFALRLPASKPIILGFYGFCAISLPFLYIVHPQPGDYPTETEYYIVENKTAVFGNGSLKYFKQSVSDVAAYSITEYPFLRQAAFDDVLSPFFTPSDTSPNIVIIIVEGLGSAFVEGGTYQGFTPFLDSLSHHSLTWKNFLSTTGRTFGVLPSLTASLPLGGQGFLELGEAMPEHHSLFTLLQANRYRSSYYYGGEISFDKQNIFLERQNIRTIVDDEDFPSSYKMSPANTEGFSWGYADGDLFTRSLDVIGEKTSDPRLDVYMTLSTHEPFLPPNGSAYRSAAERIIAGMKISPERRERLERHIDIFASLLYTDHSLREFFNAYQKRADFSNTIFIITGDHRLIPVPMESKIDRYRVPFIIASPLINRPKEFLSVSTHSDVVPTLIGFLQKRYQLKFPSLEHWVGMPVDTAAEFRNIRSRAFMPYKGEISDYIHGSYFLSGDRLFTLNDRLYAEEIRQDSIRDLLLAQRDEMNRLSNYAIANNKLYPSKPQKKFHPAPVNDDSLFAIIDGWGLNSDQLFIAARDTAFKGFYSQAQIICRRLLAINPDYNDVRTLMAGTMSWERRYEDARMQYEEVISRSPNYADAHFGLARVEFWNGNLDGALEHIRRTVELLPNDPLARILKAKIQFTMDQDDEAMKEVERVLRSPNSPAAAEATELKMKYQSGEYR